ncbi:MAG: nucleoside-diphosphate kinase [Brevinematales bacterium]|nr:nucleoside-diphosphate kinase [Brevinematales bacterium]
MESHRALVIVKPDVVEKRKIGEVISIIEKHFKIVAMKMVKMTEKDVYQFYREHVGKDFFEKLLSFMTSGKSVVLVIEGDNAIQRIREIIGDTDPKLAKPGTIRNMYGENLPRNAIHASDSDTSAKREISFFFENI